MARPPALILRAPGTNCDEETSAAWDAAGADPQTWHLARLIEEAPSALDRFAVLTLPGGFSFGDDLGAGRVFASKLAAPFGDALRRLRDRGGLILGICNGFQVLVRSGMLPGGEDHGPTTLARNASGTFEARWVRLKPLAGSTPFLTDDEPIELPVAHGEGRFLASEGARLTRLDDSGQIVLKYIDETDQPTDDHPANPNGSARSAAGLCDPTGRVFGLMPHPERFIDPYHHPRWTRTGPRAQGDGLRIFVNAVNALS